MHPHRQARLALATLLVVYVGWGAHYVWRTSFSYQGERVFCLWDDAMISMQYARNLREGHGLVWIPGGDAVQGISNLGIALVMAALHAASVAPERISALFQALNLALLAATVVGVAVSARRLWPGRPGLAGGAALATVLCAPLAVWSLLGADVGFVAAWLSAGIAVLAGAEAQGRVPARLFPALAPGLLFRPDSVLFYALLLAAAWRLPAGRRRAVEGAALGALVLGGWAAFGMLYYGDPLPNTYYLKATGSPRSAVLAAGLAQLGLWLPRLVPALALAAFATWKERRRPLVLVCAALPVASLVYSVWVGGDWSFQFGARFVVPTLPALWLLVASGASQLLELARAPATARAAGATVGAALAALLSNPAEVAAEWLDPRSTPLHREFNRNNYHFARYLARWTAPSTSLGAHWGGVPPYFSRRPAIDVLGKSDRHIAKLRVEYFVPGQKWDWDYVMKRRPDVFRGPSRGLGQRPDFRRDYVKVLTVGLAFYMRRDALAKLRDPDVVIVDLETGERKQQGGREPASPTGERHSRAPARRRSTRLRSFRGSSSTARRR